MNLLLTLLLTLCAFPLLGQTYSLPVFCGNEIFSDIVRKHYRGLQDDFTSTFEDSKRSWRGNNADPLQINVVIHVVWKENAENLHDSIIQSQIDILNQDYNRLNVDSNQLRPIFHADAGRGNIHFNLAQIIRVETDRLFTVDLLGTNLLSEAKHTSEGGSNAWDTESYLNIWIVNIQPIEIFGIEVGQILGFAFPPAGLAHWPEGVAAPSPDEDGVVLDYRVIGSNNPNMVEIPGGAGQTLKVLGRSATHEVGHYLGLRHIWGDGGLLGPNDCAQSDGIDDTPYADSQSAFDCDTTKNSCPQIDAHYNQNMPDLIENFMDYAADDCMNMFTKGQVELMRNVLLGPRSGLLEHISSTDKIQEALVLRIAPNPVRENARLAFHLDESNEVSIRVVDINGRPASTLMRQTFPAGDHEIEINMAGYPGGMYFAEMRTTQFVRAVKLIKL